MPGRFDNIGMKIRIVRQRAGLTQLALSERAGISICTLQRAEKGTFLPSLYSLSCILDALDMTMGDLIAIELEEV